MSTALGTMDLKEAAEDVAGNWKRMKCFIWYRATELKDADKWAVIYTSHRDSGLLDQSNAAVISKALKPFTENDNPDVVFESHSHFLVGHIDGFSIRVFKRGRITKAFRKYHELAERMDAYPILDEDDYSNREYEATYENIPLAAGSLKHEYELPEDWQSEVFSWLSENNESSLESRDDQGGWPTEEQIKAAFTALGYQASE
jgi:hypothetical protein